IDFDQQCYEGRKNLYLPQFFKENFPLVELGMELINDKTLKQYQAEERSLIARRLIASRYRIKDLIDCMETDTISTVEKVEQLRSELAKHHKNDAFLNFDKMGTILKLHLKLSLQKHIRKVTGI
ncbi:MAG: hypothetical protein JKX84_11295, partial [Flavobacteriales bacterium]|nr:hypothetical protein [Flavobacteriales bacterium]